MKHNTPKFDLVEVEWFDAQSSFAVAESIEELIEGFKPLHSFSTGYLLNQDKESILLGFMLFGENMTKHCQMIPRGMVKKITVIRKYKKVKRK